MPQRGGMGGLVELAAGIHFNAQAQRQHRQAHELQKKIEAASEAVNRQAGAVRSNLQATVAEKAERHSKCEQSHQALLGVVIGEKRKHSRELSEANEARRLTAEHAR
eukprot:RCo013604